MLEVNCLGFEYRSGGRGISGVTFSAAAAQLTALVGPSGSGKSTLLACIAGILRPREGDVSLDGRDQGSDISAWRRDVAFIPQSSSVFERLTIWENVAVAWGEPAVRSRPPRLGSRFVFLGVEGRLTRSLLNNLSACPRD